MNWEAERLREEVVIKMLCVPHLRINSCSEPDGGTGSSGDVVSIIVGASCAAVIVLANIVYFVRRWRSNKAAAAATS